MLGADRYATWPGGPDKFNHSVALKFFCLGAGVTEIIESIIQEYKLLCLLPWLCFNFYKQKYIWWENIFPIWPSPMIFRFSFDFLRHFLSPFLRFSFVNFEFSCSSNQQVIHQDGVDFFPFSAQGHRLPWCRKCSGSNEDRINDRSSTLNPAVVEIPFLNFELR